MHALTREEIRALDRCAIDRLGIPGVILMENAGRNAADAVAELLGGAAGRSVAVVAGAGNNGGDGFVIARHLALGGAAVVTYLVVPPAKITGDARVNLDALRALRHDVREAADALDGVAQQLKGFDAVVDAVGGTGIRGPLRGGLAAAVEQINAAGRPVVAVDLPTGLDCDTGEASGPAVQAALTVTMLARKKGFDAPGAAAYTGRVRVVDIGVPPEVVAEIAGAAAGG
jgi:NAD(P)H-hydrate epimerase